MCATSAYLTKLDLPKKQLTFGAVCVALGKNIKLPIYFVYCVQTCKVNWLGWDNSWFLNEKGQKNKSLKWIDLFMKHLQLC